jgi:hypothetical protein
MHAGPPEGTPFADNETVGVTFSPDGRRMYFGAQRSFGVVGIPLLPAGVVYEISGPFRLPATAGNGNGASGTAGARSGAIRLRVRKRKRIQRFLRHGLPISLDLDEPAGVLATLRVPSPGGDSQVIARAQPSVAVSGRVGLRLTPVRNAPNLLDTDDEFVARLKVVVTDTAGKRTVLRRRVKLVAGD